MSLFNKNYFSIYTKKGNIFGQISDKLKIFENNLARKYKIFNPSLYIIFKLPKNAKILDVGCGVGNWLKLVHKYRPDIQLYGVDIGDVEDLLPKYIKFKKCSGDNLPFEDNYFDYITNMHMLEHILNPQDFIKEFYRVLKKGGYCYIETPYIARVFFPDKGNFYSDYTHIKPFTISGLTRLLKDYGFKSIYGGKIKKKFLISLFLILLSPLIILRAILGKDNGALYTLLSFIIGGSCYVIGKK